MGLEHSKTFPFSSAHRWGYCDGAPKMCKDEDDVSTPESEEGEAAHWVAQQMLETFKMGGDGLPIGRVLVNRQAPNGVVITDDMFDGAITYYNIIIKVVGEDRANLMIEQRVSAHYTLDPEAWGTADAIYYDAKTNTLYIWDFKYGHFSVVAFDNLQLAGYAIATCETFKYVPLNPRLSMNIVQPRCYDGQGPLRNWTVALDGLRAHTNIMKGAIINHRMNKGKVTSGSWCRECPARYKCPAIRQATAVAIDFSTTAIPLNLSNEALAYELDITDIAHDRIKQRKLAIETEAEKRVRAGQLIPGRRMEDTIGNREWTDPKIVPMIADSFGLNLTAQPKPLSVAQAEKVLKAAGVDEQLLKPYYHNRKTGVKLIADDGSRARQLFSQEKI